MYIELTALIISIMSLVISTFFAIKSLNSNSKANELSESQKTAALISIIAPACESSEQWKIFIEYLSKNNKLPSFSEEDEVFLAAILSRLEIKAKIINGKLKLEN